MHSEFTIIIFLLSALAIELDKITQFTHPSLHVAAIAGMIGVVCSLVLAA
jgi:hypothetical protein